MSESTFQSTVLKYLNSLPGCTAENVSGNSQQSGRPDINGVYKGRSFRIELKVLDEYNKPTRKQMLNLMKWFKSGSAICVSYTLRDVDNFMTNFMTETPWRKVYDEKCCSFGYYKKGMFTNDFFKQYKQLYVQN